MNIDELKNSKGKNHPIVKRWEKLTDEEEKKEKISETEKITTPITVSPQLGMLETPVITYPSMILPSEGITIILKNAMIYAEKVIIRKESNMNEKAKVKKK